MSTFAAARVQAYFELTKPRITLLVLITTFGGMWLAQGGMPDLFLVFVTLLGTGLAASSSSTLNNFIDRRVDVLMQRTSQRPLPTGRVKPTEALVLGIVLGAIAFVLLSLTVNFLTAALAIGTIFFYVVIYTAWLKRTTPACTSIGGIPGAAPPVIGWAAVSGDIGLPVLALFLIMFLWQPPHFWALAIMRADEYRRAGLPMLPVVRGEAYTKQRMLLYMLLLLPATVLFYALGYGGLVYLSVAVIAGGWYMYKTVLFIRRPVTPVAARQLFFGSIWYLTALFAGIGVDTIVSI